MCLEIFPNTGHILNPKCLNYALEELQPIPNRNTVVCLQAMKFGLKGAIMCCKYRELEIGAGNKTIMQQGNSRGAGWIRAALPSLREMRLLELHPDTQGSAGGG